jgi:hypothetical protein
MLPAITVTVLWDDGPAPPLDPQRLDPPAMFRLVDGPLPVVEVSIAERLRRFLRL